MRINFITIKFFRILFIIIKLLLIKIKCDGNCEGCSPNDCKGQNNCDSNCRLFLNNNCFPCTDLQANDYYNFLSNENSCVKIEISEINDDYKLINGTRGLLINQECPESFKYQLGSICYQNQPSNTKLLENNQYTCLFSYTKEIINSLEYLNCLGRYEKCPREYNYLTKVNDYYQCSKECMIDNYKILKEYEDNTESFAYNYCIEDCPPTQKYYYITGDNSFECLTKCDFENKGDIFNGINCENNDANQCKYYIIDPSKNIFECLKDENECTNDYPYLYNKGNKNYCLKSCKYTQTIQFFNSKTYIFEYSNNNKIAYKCLSDTEIRSLDNIYYKDESSLKLVSDCKTSISGPYHNESDKTCYNSCYKYYRDLECVEDCNENQNSNEETSYFKDEETKICYTICPFYLNKGFHNERNECVSCKDGFYKDDLKCYNSCELEEGKFYHNYNDNYCFENECKDYSIYKYHIYRENICHMSCSDFNVNITDNNLKVKFEKNYVCFKNEQELQGTEDEFKYKYKTSSGIIKFIKQEGLLECLEENLKYIKNMECVERCDNQDYIVPPKQDKIGECLTENQLSEENNCKYYNKSKICSNECKFFKILNNEGNLGKNNENENCVVECGDDYFENEIDKTCVSTCKNGLYKDKLKKKCVSKCDTGFFEVKNNEKICVEKCKNSENEEIYAFYMDTGECINSCPNTHNFSFINTQDHQQCLSKCPKYNKENICMEKCQYYLNGNCVDNCGENKYLHPGNICSNETCPRSSPFFYLNSSSNLKICETSCPQGYYINYKSNSESTNNIECISKCDNGVIYNNGCYDNCPEGLYNSNDNCISKCTKKYYNDSNGFKCINECNEIEGYPYLTSSGECVSQCPEGENYIWENNECLAKCKNDYYFIKFKELTKYTIYKCVENCIETNNKYYINGTKECLSKCENLHEYNNVCYQNCLSFSDKNFSIKNDLQEESGVITYTCIESCGTKFYGNDHICINSCNDLPFNKTANYDNSCITECDIKSNYKFLNEIGGSLYCKDKCEDNKRYLTSNYICLDKCPPPTNYVVKDGNRPVECLNKCPEEKPFSRKNEYNEYICSETECGSEEENTTYYYLNDKICLEHCERGDYLIGSHICTSFCDSYNSTRLYIYENNTVKKCVPNCKDTDDKKFTSLEHKCVEGCGSEEFYDENDFICRINCPNGKKIDGQICRESCYNDNENLRKYENENGYCVDNCSTSNSSYIYHKENEYKCINNCSGLYIDNNVCRNSCDNNFIYEKNCVSECPPLKRFYKEDDKICLSDCPENLPFYSKEGEKITMCKESCNAYIPNSNSKIKSKLCLDDCKDEYPYFIYENETSENRIKICLFLCPSTHPYYKNDKTIDSKNLECFKECPKKLVHLPEIYKCINFEDCETGIIKYDTKECVEQCSKNDLIYQENNGGKIIKFCVSNCTIIKEKLYGELHPNATVDIKETYNRECMTFCPENSIEIDGKFCDCEGFFYYDKRTGLKNCLSKNITSCEEVPEYPINKAEEKECTNYCEGILSLSGLECHNNSYNCEQNEIIKTMNNGDKQCDCIDKFYYINVGEKKIKKCLSQNEECPSSYSMLIKETKECLQECNNSLIYNKIFGKTCVSNCPYFTVQKENNKCECNGKWYVTDNYDIICLTGDCPNSKSLYIEETKQCVSSCIGTGFEVYYNKTCISNCSGVNMNVSDSTGNIYLEKISTKYCKCNSYWYYDSYGNEICNTNDNIESCKDIEGKNFNYMINETNQCVIECPEEYKYSFGDQCFKSCNIEGENLLQDDNLKTCKCKEFWKNQNNKIICNITCEGEFKIINDTKECIEGDKNCPNDYPLLFNKTCYKQGQCPEENNAYYNYFKEECSCKEKWYIENEKVFCRKKGEDCPPDYKYLIYSTKECIKDKVNSLYEFNNVFYENCPEQTKNSTATNTCICDTLLGYYYINEEDGNKSICAQEKCPNDKNYIDYDKKECISSCNDHELKLYQGICYEKCPNLTEYEENSQECQLLSIDTKITLQNLEKEMLENIVDLYARSNNYKNNNPNVGQKIVTTNGTCEFYGVNKNNKGITNQNIQSDLSYIDVSECIEKIYNSNKMKDEDDIVILKFDINKTPNNFLINPVEYKFINSRTGQELDASICEHNSIRISYPIHELINKFDKMKKNLRYLEYISIDLISNNKDSLREKIDKGKEIVEDYSEIDIFNINDKIYLDFCIAVEVDGKDLVLEDRFNYFYPLLSLCENNCTYNHTDFINERIFCDCSYKKEFDFERQYSSLELNTNEININQKGNSNIVVMKCIANLKYLKSITNNGGFLYTLIIILIEFILLFIIIFYGIKSLSNKFQKKMNSNEDDLDEQIEVLNIKTNEKKNYEDIKTSQRILDNPPKKNIPDFEMEFIPQEYLFLFFNQGQKNIIKKVERDSVPFKTGLNTRILLEKKKGVNYENINPRGPFPPGQNLLIIVDSMDDDINDYLKIEEEQKPKNIDKKDEKESNKISQKPSIYQKNKNKFSISEYDPSDENYSIYDLDEEDDLHEKGFIENIKRNQKLIRRNYDYSLRKNDSNFIEILIAEIIDKIYITNILLFTKKFDILALQLAVYFLCHTLLLVLNTLFFDIKTIKKIWREENYPGLGYYLGFGFLACIIIWIIYRMILCLLTNNDKIKEILKLIHYNKKLNLKKENNISKKYNNLMWKVKFKIAFYSVIQFLLLIFCFLYLTVFCSVYTGTKTKIFKAYGIALIEILIIKIIYAIVLAILRYVSLTNRKKGLYDVVKFMNTYLV